MPTLAFAAPAAPDRIQSAIEQALAHYRTQPGNLLPVLHAVQEALGHIPPSSVPALAEGLNRSRAEIQGVISFYPYFRETPPAPIKLEICRAEACQAMGANDLAAHAQQSLGCNFNGRSRNEQVDLTPVYCLGLCAQSPAVAINEQPYVRMTPQRLDALLEVISESLAAQEEGSEP